MTTLNLKGFMVGNGVTDFNLDVFPSYPQTLAGFQIIKQQMLDDYEKLNCFYTFNDAIPYNNTPECDAAWEAINALAEGLNWYDLFRHVYNGPLLRDENRLGEAIVGGEVKQYKRGYTIQEYTPWMKDTGFTISSPLLGDAVTDYINDNQTRAALHIPDGI